jgi:ABC-type uncharacterized transport system substrate-binding protein
LEARRPEEISGAMERASKLRPGAMLVHSDGLFFGQRRRIADLAVKIQLPTIYPWREAAEAGGFMTYGANVAYNWWRAGSFVDRILKGAKPGDVPVERPTKFELVINLKTAKGLGLTVPPSLLQRADQVIE